MLVFQNILTVYKGAAPCRILGEKVWCSEHPALSAAPCAQQGPGLPRGAPSAWDI